jgi:hypothetical protein
MKARAIATNAYLSNYQDYVNTAGANLQAQADIVLNDTDLVKEHADVVQSCAQYMCAWTSENDAVNAVIACADATREQASLSDRQAVKSMSKYLADSRK